MMSENILTFTGDIASGTMDMNTTEMVCVPSKEKYAEVDLTLKDGMNFCIGKVVGRWLSFEEKKKLGYEIERRWNLVTDKNKNELLQAELNEYQKIIEIEQQIKPLKKEIERLYAQWLAPGKRFKIYHGKNRITVKILQLASLSCSEKRVSVVNEKTGTQYLVGFEEFHPNSEVKHV
jgi:uncharacterized small protein (DUF1192 family)